MNAVLPLIKEAACFAIARQAASFMNPSPNPSPAGEGDLIGVLAIDGVYLGPPLQGRGT